MNIIVLVIVLAAVAVATVLLWRTLSAARSINDKADRISRVGRGINTSTDAVIQLHRTNRTADSILNTANPLEGKLDRIVRLGASIDRLAVSINGTAGRINSSARTINGTATTIGGTARGINGQAAAILDVGRRIETDVRLINQNLSLGRDTSGNPGTRALARAARRDARNILNLARSVRNHAREIDENIPESLELAP